MKNILLAIIFLLLFTSCERRIPEPAYIDAVFIMDDDGSNMTHLIDRTPGSVQFTPNDEKIIGKDSRIWSLNLDGSGFTYLVDSLSIDISLPVFSPDGSKIAFTSGDIFIMDIDGTNLQNLTNTPDVRDRFPHFSPHGDSIVYTTDSDTLITISIIDKNSESSRILISNTPSTKLAQVYYYPRYNISGDKIYYNFFGELKGLYSINTDGTDNNLILGGYPELYPASMSEDGSKLVFSCNSHIYIMNTTNNEIVDLGSGSYPVISSDGTKIVYTISNAVVYTMNSDGSEKNNLGYGNKPCFSWNSFGDNYKIVFAGEREIKNKGILY